ncbi:MAG: hypothetical protein RQ966_00340 [Acetobacteraceae bacterium]|nr:hypothetical protein [Acetobacteraceae bacterium]
MRTGLPALALLGGIASFAACGLSLALLGLGLPYALGAAISSACGGLLIYSLGRWAVARGAAAAPAEPAEAPALARLAQLEREMSSLRHELRGALSPALMVSDRLLKNDDPLVRRAGDAVVRSIERATALIGPDSRHPPEA